MWKAFKIVSWVKYVPYLLFPSIFSIMMENYFRCWNIVKWYNYCVWYFSRVVQNFDAGWVMVHGIFGWIRNLPQVQSDGSQPSPRWSSILPLTDHIFWRPFLVYWHSAGLTRFLFREAKQTIVKTIFYHKLILLNLMWYGQEWRYRPRRR